MNRNRENNVSVPYPTLREAVRVWIKVALHSFGGPAGQIAVMHKYVVEEKKWLGESRFLHALNYCMLLPGPEAQQLVTYIGWLLHRTKGGVIAGVLFVLPGFVSILILSIIYSIWKDVSFVQGIFYGIKPAVLAIVVGAVIKIGRKALKNEVMVVIAMLAFIAIFFFKTEFPVIVLAAALIGYSGGKIWPEKFHTLHAAGSKNDKSGEGLHLLPLQPTLSGTLQTALLWLGLWSLPVILLVMTLGFDHIFTQESIFFSKSAVVTFGGAYSVLAYISQKAVDSYGWLQPGEMLDGLGMAETTPGPLIQVVQFVGYMGAFRQSGDLDPIVAGIIASVLVTWVTFIPSFLFIFTGAPYIEQLRGNKSLTSALSAITAAVVGVMLNLGIWFSLHTVFANVGELTTGWLHIPLPVWNTADPGAVFISVAAMVVYFGLKWDMLKTIGFSALMGLIWWFAIK